jgi:two-component system nitrogen regulation sensor histidine kinase GlnL
MTVIDELDTAVVELDARNRIHHLNLAAEQCLSVSRERLRGEHLKAMEGLPESLRAALRDSREDRRTRRLHECPLPGGAYDCTIQVLRNDHMLLEFHSLDWARQQRQLQQLEVQTGLLELLRRNLGHEIRNPLGGIRGAAQLMADELADRELGDLARMIMREVDRVEELIRRFWQPEMRREALDLHRVLEEALELLESGRGGNLRIERDYDPSLPRPRGDAAAIRQVLLNLARNAQQAGASRIVVRTRVEHGSALLEKDRGMLLRLDLEDNGEGVPERLQPLLFLPMVTGRRDGTGLGLALAQQIAADHGGLITYKALEQGSRFTLRLPALEQEKEQAREPGGTPEAAHG